MIHETLSAPIMICGEPSSEKIIEAQNRKIDKATAIATQALNSSMQSIIDTHKNWFWVFKALNPKIFLRDQHIYDSDIAAASKYIESKDISTSPEIRSFVNLRAVKKPNKTLQLTPSRWTPTFFHVLDAADFRPTTHARSESPSLTFGFKIYEDHTQP